MRLGINGIKLGEKGYQAARNGVFLKCLHITPSLKRTVWFQNQTFQKFVPWCFHDRRTLYTFKVRVEMFNLSLIKNFVKCEDITMEKKLINFYNRYMYIIIQVCFILFYCHTCICVKYYARNYIYNQIFSLILNKAEESTSSIGIQYIWYTVKSLEFVVT